MTSQDDMDVWQSRYVAAVVKFASECAELKRLNPFDRPPLEYIMPFLMTELWDRFFSQTEIRTGFSMAVDQLPHYAVGEERRGDRR